MNKDKLLEIIYSSIDQINNTLESNQAIKKDLNEIIIGYKSKLDSTSELSSKSPLPVLSEEVNSIG